MSSYKNAVNFVFHFFYFFVANIFIPFEVTNIVLMRRIWTKVMEWWVLCAICASSCEDKRIFFVYESNRSSIFVTQSATNCCCSLNLGILLAKRNPIRDFRVKLLFGSFLWFSFFIYLVVNLWWRESVEQIKFIWLSPFRVNHCHSLIWPFT